MELSLSFHSDLKHNRIDHICMVSLLYVFGYDISVLVMFEISFGSIRTQHVANRFVYPDDFADVYVEFVFF